MGKNDSIPLDPGSADKLDKTLPKPDPKPNGGKK
jgi:hypothetical protein